MPRDGEPPFNRQIVAVRTTRGDVLGALLADGIRQPQPGQFFYGTGESFLFSVSRAEAAGAEDDPDTGTESEGTDSGGGWDSMTHSTPSESPRIPATDAPPDGIGEAGTTDVRVYH